MQNEMILTAGPSITDLEIDYVNDAIRTGWNSNWNSYIKRFESSFAEYIGTQHATSTSSCTGALHLALLALGIGPGDEIIVPELTWIATASCIAYVGATPVFCDVEEVSWCMDPESLKSCISERTRAIIPVHLYGHPANMPDIMEIAKNNNIHVIEDAAPSIGATVNQQKTGSFGDISCFSFQGAKVLVTGEGGMLVTNNDELFCNVQKLGDHCRDPEKALWNTGIGYKYKMSNLQAALGLAQLERIQELIDRKREINEMYHNQLDGIEAIRVSTDKNDCQSIHWMTSIELRNFNNKQRLDFIKHLKTHKIDSRPVFYPLSSMPMFTNIESNKVAYRIGHSAINLPSGHNITAEQTEYICDTLKRILS